MILGSKSGSAQNLEDPPPFFVENTQESSLTVTYFLGWLLQIANYIHFLSLFLVFRMKPLFLKSLLQIFDIRPTEGLRFFMLSLYQLKLSHIEMLSKVNYREKV